MKLNYRSAQDKIPQARSDSLSSLNTNLTASDTTKFRFATDGEGNYGFLKADDSFVPFRSIGEDSFYLLSSGTSWNCTIDNALNYKAIIICCDLSSTNAVRNTAVATVSGGEKLLTQGVIHDNGQGGIFTTIILPKNNIVSVIMSNTSNFNYGRHVAYGIK